MSEWDRARADAADAVIDRAVREIMSAEPRPGFRLRVVARLRAEPASSRTWTRLSAGVVGAAAVAIVLLIVLARSVDRPAEAPRTAGQQAVTTSPPQVRPPLVPRRSTPADVRPTPGADRGAAQSEPRMVRAASLAPGMTPIEGAASRIVEIQALPAIEPIIVAPLFAAPSSAPEVAIRPLPPIERIAIPPLSPPR